MPNAPRNTGLQVIHYVSAVLTSATPFVASGVFVGELPVGAIITDVDVTVATAFGAGVQLVLSRTPGGPPLVTFGVSATGKQKLINALSPLAPAEFARGGQFYAYLTGAVGAGALGWVVLSYAPIIG